MPWNGSDGRGAISPIKRSVSSRRKLPIAWIWGGLAAISITAVIIVVALNQDTEKPKTADKTSNPVANKIRPEKPDRKPKPKPALSAPAKPKEKKIPESVKADSQGILRWPNGARYIKDYAFATNSIDIYAGQKKLFKHPAEIHIATLLTHKPGQMLIGGFEYGDAFKKSLIKSLKEEVQFSEDDTEEEHLLKLDVIEAKKELQAAMDRGEDPVAIMQEAREELIRQFQYRQNLQEQITAISKEEGATLQNKIDLTEAANVMLKEQGIPEFPLGVLRRRMERLKELGRSE